MKGHSRDIYQYNNFPFFIPSPYQLYLLSYTLYTLDPYRHIHSVCFKTSLISNLLTRWSFSTKRMQRVFSVKFTPDSKYVLSGSDDGNIRLWRANASKREGIKSARQREALEYNEKLVERYAHMPEIRRIARHRHIPKVVKKAGEIKSEELKAIKRREENERKHTKKQYRKRRPEREKMVLATEK